MAEPTERDDAAALEYAEELVRSLVAELEQKYEKYDGYYCIECGEPHDSECPAGKGRRWLERRGKPMPPLFVVDDEDPPPEPGTPEYRAAVEAAGQTSIFSAATGRTA